MIEKVWPGIIVGFDFSSDFYQQIADKLNISRQEAKKKCLFVSYSGSTKNLL